MCALSCMVLGLVIIRGGEPSMCALVCVRCAGGWVRLCGCVWVCLCVRGKFHVGTYMLEHLFQCYGNVKAVLSLC